MVNQKILYTSINNKKMHQRVQQINTDSGGRAISKRGGEAEGEAEAAVVGATEGAAFGVKEMVVNAMTKGS